MTIQTILSDNEFEYCGRPDKHPCELFLQLEDSEPRGRGMEGRTPYAVFKAGIARKRTRRPAARKEVRKAA